MICTRIVETVLATTLGNTNVVTLGMEKYRSVCGRTTVRYVAALMLCYVPVETSFFKFRVYGRRINDEASNKTNCKVSGFHKTRIVIITLNIVNNF